MVLKDIGAADHSSADPTRTVHVGLGARSYDIEIGPGLLAKSGNLIARAVPNARCAVVTDDTVANLHLDAL